MINKEKTIKGIIFDFNGTLFWDSKLHDKAWNDFAIKIRGKGVSSEDLLLRIHGKINKDILKFVLGRDLQDDESELLSEEKEKMYRDLIYESEKKYQLAPGTIELLNWLDEAGIPKTIATSSQKSNVDFYFDYLGLSKWFDYEKVVYDNGKINPKPSPDIFIEAAKKIQVDIHDCMILEDSFTGILAARKSGANKVVFVENDVPVSFEKIKDFVDNKVNNLMEIKQMI
jgi:HAD superfamily hydrolase (TIGR01509 family)